MTPPSQPLVGLVTITGRISSMTLPKLTALTLIILTAASLLAGGGV